MKRALLHLLAVAAAAVAAPALAAESPFAGTWRLDPSRSEFTGDTLSFADAGGGKLRFTSAGVSYTFAADGKKTHMPLGYDVAWRKKGKRAWEMATFAKGKKVATDVLEVSADGRSLKYRSKATRPDGTKFFRGSFSLSEDGKTLTWKQQPEGVDEPMTGVFTRE